MILNPIDAGDFLSFKLDGETFAMEAYRSREVLKYSSITKVPRMPEHLPGVVNVRGNVIAVIDFGLVLGTKTAENAKKDWLVIADAALGDERFQIGVPADAVQAVICLGIADIAPAPEIGININTDFIQGVGKQDDSFLLIVDVDKIVAAVYATISNSKSLRTDHGPGRQIC